MSNEMKHAIYHVGKLKLNDNNTSISFTGVVEKKPKFISSLFWLHFDSLKNKEHISIAVSAIELRAIAYAIRAKYRDRSFVYDSKSGGTEALKTFFIPEDTLPLKIGANENKVTLVIALDQFEYLGLADELLRLVDSTVDAAYKTQQILEMKKLQAKKKALKNATD